MPDEPLESLPMVGLVENTLNEFVVQEHMIDLKFKLVVKVAVEIVPVEETEEL